jgi:hypothetical protein
MLVTIATNFHGNSDENPTQLKKEEEYNGNVETIRGIIRLYVVVT